MRYIMLDTDSESKEISIFKFSDGTTEKYSKVLDLYIDPLTNLHKEYLNDIIENVYSVMLQINPQDDLSVLEYFDILTLYMYPDIDEIKDDVIGDFEEVVNSDELFILTIHMNEVGSYVFIMSDIDKIFSINYKDLR